MEKVMLVTGFEPFDGAEINPSFEAVKGLRDVPELRGRVEVLELPVVFGKAGDLLAAKIRELRPSAVICVGLAASRKWITPELVAVNFRSARIPDNEGNRPEWEKIDPDGPDGIFTRLPVREMLKRLEEAEIPAQLSQSAGAYVCNEVMYRVLRDYDGPAGFIHVPASRELGGSMSVGALAVCVGTVEEFSGRRV